MRLVTIHDGEWSIHDTWIDDSPFNVFPMTRLYFPITASQFELPVFIVVSRFSGSVTVTWQ